MSTRFFQIIIVAILLATAPATTSAAPPLVEGRGIWIDAKSIPTNDEAMWAFVNSLAKANLNVLFPEVVRRGYTLYPSKIGRQDPGWNGYDPLAAMIREAHARGMEVHPWVWVFRAGYTEDKGHILTSHPEWTAVNKWGETLSANGGYWICPSIPEARDYLSSIFKEIASNYDVDGLHLDYIRFENQFPIPYCYNSSCREKFKAEHGVDPIEIDPFNEMQVTWHLWKEELVNSFVRRVSDEMHRIRPEIKISAAVGSHPDHARESLLQNWVNWVDNKWVDFLNPMAYIADSDKFRQMIAVGKDAVGDRTIIMPGLGLHTHKEIGTTLEQIQLARNAMADGVTIFASIYLKDPLKQALALGPFQNKAEIPFRKPAERVKTLLDAALAVRESRMMEASSYLKDAARLLGYLAYQAADTGYIEPTRPPILIPKNVLPMPSVNVTKVTEAPIIDGKLDEEPWLQAAQIRLLHTELGDAAPVQTEVMLAYDDKNLYVAYISHEPAMENIKASITKHDGPTFYDDSIELFLDPWAKRREYYHFSANTLGTQFDAKVNNPSVNPKWQVAAAKHEDKWTVEAAIPFESLGIPAPEPNDTWFANFAKNRWATGEPLYITWSVPYGTFHRPERFGTIIFGPAAQP